MRLGISLMHRVHIALHWWSLLHGRLILRIIACSGKWTFLYTEVWITLVELSCFYDKNYSLFHIVYRILEFVVHLFFWSHSAADRQIQEFPSKQILVGILLTFLVSWLQLLRFGGVMFCMCKARKSSSKKVGYLIHHIVVVTHQSLYHLKEKKCKVLPWKGICLKFQYILSQ